MTMPRRNSRTITVGGDKYRWVLHYFPFWDIGGWQDRLYVTIEKVEAPRRRIRATFNGTTFHVREVKRSIEEFLPSRTVTPDVVRHVIEHATEAGWRPESAAGDFIMSDSERLFGVGA